MSRTFEELASGELDALYQGALFLSGGDPREAERLVIDAVTLAFEEYTPAGESESVERWFEIRLVRSFLEHVSERSASPPPEAEQRFALDEGTFQSIDAHNLLDAAATLPPRPRAAIWLVLLRRWSYRDTAEALQLDPELLPGLLGYRDVLIQELIATKQPSRSRLETGS